MSAFSYRKWDSFSRSCSAVTNCLPPAYPPWPPTAVIIWPWAKSLHLPHMSVLSCRCRFFCKTPTITPRTAPNRAKAIIFFTETKHPQAGTYRYRHIPARRPRPSAGARRSRSNRRRRGILPAGAASYSSCAFSWRRRRRLWLSSGGGGIRRSDSGQRCRSRRRWEGAGFGGGGA